ncbi:MAG: SRPBCC domain-containing protein [Leptospirales bacterium]|jgi:uncharacterized protein YndB with AHSA1/START domain
MKTNAKGGFNRGETIDLNITRLFKAPRELVFAVWSDVEHFKRWWGPADCVMSDLEFDFRVGGALRCRLVHEDGDYWMRGEFREIAEPERIVFTHGWENERGEIETETLITVRFFAEGDATRMVFFQQGFLSNESRDSHEEGWSSCLDRLLDYIAREYGAPQGG